MPEKGLLWPEGSRRSRRARLAAVCLVVILSLVCKTAALLSFPGTNGFYGISHYHAIVAYSLLTDGTLTFREPGFPEWWERSRIRTDGYVDPAEFLPALRASRPHGVFHIYPPGYPLLLASTFRASGSFRYSLVQFLQNLLDMIGVSLLLVSAGMALRRFPEGLAAAALYAVATFPALSQLVLPDVPMLFFGAALLATSLWTASRDRLPGYLLLGLLLGFVANFRSDILVASPFLAAGIWRARGVMNWGTLARIVSIAVTTFILLVPYGFIQKRATGHFRIATPALGTNLWEALGETPNPHGAVLSDLEADILVQREGLRRLTPEGEAFLVRKWRAAVASDPGWFLDSVDGRIGRVARYLRALLEPGFPFREMDRKRELILRGVDVRYGDYKRSTGQGILRWGLAHPRSFLGTIYDVLMPRVKSLSLFSFSLLLLVGSVAGLLRSRYGLLIGAIPLAYLCAFSVLHVEPRYLAPLLGPLLYLGCHGLGTLGQARVGAERSGQRSRGIRLLS